MKTTATIFLIFFALLFTACDQVSKESLDIEKNQSDSLRNVSETKDSVINEMLGEFNQIRENLKEIRGREGEIQIKVRKEGEVEDVRLSISEDVDRISDLMRKNEQMIDQLNKRLNASNIEMREFKRLIADLNEDIQSKNAEIQRLNKLLEEKEIQLGSLYFTVDSLNTYNKVQAEKLKEKIDEINKGYFAYGTFKELRDQNVITKEGGFLGLGKSESLKDDFNQEYFSEVDIRNQKSFLIYANKARLITTHPESSYKFIGENKVDSLVIVNPEAFWNASKYMVVVID